MKKRKVQLTHEEKIYFPESGITKGELLAYYEEMAPLILPYVKERPISLRRYPEGIEGEHFFQKNLLHYPEWIETAQIQHESKLVHYLLINNVDSLLYAVNLGSIEIHPFFSRVRTLDNPDFLVLDLDPVEVDFEHVIEVAQLIHGLLANVNIDCYCKTSGSRGLHICIPLRAKYSYEVASQFAELIATWAHEQSPEITSLERSPKNRQHKVYIDYLQNHLGQTLAAPYTVRAKPHAPVSTPLEWSEVKKGLNPLDFTIKTVRSRFQTCPDFFKPVLGRGVNLSALVSKTK